jgi:outer membrane protein OmpA-like peptidoglycan-associated protein
MMRQTVFFSTMLLGMLGSVVIVQAGQVSVTLSGVAFEGGPAFEIGVNGTVIGSGTVDDPVPEGQTFTFDAADDLLAQPGDLTVRLTNDYFAGPDQDRSLTVLGATVGSTTLAPNDFVIVQDGTPVERDFSAGALIWSGNETAVANAPSSGWWIGAEANAAATCTDSVEVLGFERGSVASEAGSGANLSPFIEAANAGKCSVTITGYADVTGTELTNLRLTAARAGAVLDDLLVGGARFPNVSIVPTTGTEQFGAEGSENRRVTVQLWSPAPQPVAQPDNPVSQLAEQARNANLAQILVLGWGSDGGLYVRSSNTDPKEVLWLLEQAKARLIAGEPVLGLGQ